MLRANNFVFRGSHENPSASTLPKWVPRSAASKMIEVHNKRLRKALDILVKSSTVVRNRANTTSSRRLSVDSLQGNVYTVPETECDDFIVTRISKIDQEARASSLSWSHPVFWSSFDHGSMPVVDVSCTLRLCIFTYWILLSELDSEWLWKTTTCTTYVIVSICTTCLFNPKLGYHLNIHCGITKSEERINPKP